MVQVPPGGCARGRGVRAGRRIAAGTGRNSGSAWAARGRVLRVGRPAVIDAEVAASSAAAAVLPVPAVLDRAEAGDMSTLDPAARARRSEPGWAPLCEGWAESARLLDVPAAHRAWACAFMLRDLTRRYTADELGHVAGALGEARAASGDPG
jgi:hypothetical protein